MSPVPASPALHVVLVEPEIRARYRSRLVQIPILDERVRSLNLSTSVALALYEVLRQRRSPIAASETR